MRRELLKAVIVCGSRDWTDAKTIERVLYDELLECGDEPLVIIEGQCPHGGADIIAGEWADMHHDDGVARVPYPANWKRHGRSAGPRRNQAMLDYLLARLNHDCHGIEVIAFHDDLESSRGTKDMVDRAHKAGVSWRVVTTDGALTTAERQADLFGEP